MAENGNGRLTSWKEIAAYLGCDARTCLRWEKDRGLPVHRPGGQPGPRVFAWKHELDAWLAGKQGAGPAPAPSPGASPASDLPAAAAGSAGNPPRLSRARKIHIAVAALSVLAVLCIIGLRILGRDRVPADFHIDGNRLLIVNKAGEELWRFDTGLDELKPESEYRQFSQFRRWDDATGFSYAPGIYIGDIDGDRRKEVLFVPLPSVSGPSGPLYCFDDRGRQRWPHPFRGGAPRRYGQHEFSQDYETSFEVHDLDGDGRREILAISNQHTDWPTQLAILDCEGNALGEYWNSGRIFAVLIADVDADGRGDLLIGGTNNGYESAFLAVFDPLQVHGSSPTGKYPRDPALADGSERAYIVFPWSDVDTAEDVRTFLNSIERLDNGRLRCQTAKTNLLFDLDPGTLACAGLTFGHSFRQIHARMTAAGTVRSDYESDAYRDKLMHGLRYWNGRELVNTPAWVRRTR